MKIARILCVAILLTALNAGQTTAAQIGETTERVSVATDGTQGDGKSDGNGIDDPVSISTDGRYVAFTSDATNLVAGDTNGYSDVFVRDRQNGTTQRVSVDNDDKQGNVSSRACSLSADGRYVGFISSATNLVADDTNGFEDIFVRDRQDGITERVSVASGSDGTQGNGDSWGCTLSADGRYVAFVSDANNLVSNDTNAATDIFVRDRQNGTTQRVSVGDNISTEAIGISDEASISADGRYVTFESNASNLVVGDTNGYWDIFVRDLQNHTTERVSVASDGTQANASVFEPSISANGRFVIFETFSDKLVPGDSGWHNDVFIHDRQNGKTERVSVASDGTQANDSVYESWMSADGRFVTFASPATNLVTGDTNGFSDIFVHDRELGTTERVSVASDGTQGIGDSEGGSISADGHFISFYSSAPNLVAGDTNGVTDVFARSHTVKSVLKVYIPILMK